MAHDHAHDNAQTYYVEQLCTIGICGALGGIAVMMYRSSNMLYFIAPKLQVCVLLGGTALLVLVAVRTLVVWIQAGRTPKETPEHDHDHEHCHDHSLGAACDHDHDHDHAHGHGHNHGHGEDHGHDHGWAPWRYVILLLPVVLYFLGLPSAKEARADFRQFAGGTDNLQQKEVVERDKGKVFSVNFPELSQMAYSPENRATYEGKTIRLTGEYVPINDRMFRLVRYKINCCAADRVPLDAVIMLDQASSTVDPQSLLGKWVEVEGQVQFQQRPDRPDVWLTLVVVKPTPERPINELIKIVKPDPSYYLY